MTTTCCACGKQANPFAIDAFHRLCRDCEKAAYAERKRLTDELPLAMVRLSPRRSQVIQRTLVCNYSNPTREDGVVVVPSAEVAFTGTYGQCMEYFEKHQPKQPTLAQIAKRLVAEKQ